MATPYHTPTGLIAEIASSDMLLDESSVATRLALVSLKISLFSLLHSYHSDEGVKLLLQFLQVDWGSRGMISESKSINY
jgi:hypothetical protein